MIRLMRGEFWTALAAVLIQRMLPLRPASQFDNVRLRLSPIQIADNSSGFVSILKVSLCLDQPHDRIAK
jgi:hypothetical protein